METILSFEDVSYSYLDGSSTVTILDKANYDFEKGCYNPVYPRNILSRTVLYS